MTRLRRHSNHRRGCNRHQEWLVVNQPFDKIALTHRIGGNGWTHLIHHAMKCLGQDVTLGQITLYAGVGSKFKIGESGSIPISKRGTIAPTRLDSQRTSSGELVMGDWL